MYATFCVSILVLIIPSTICEEICEVPSISNGYLGRYEQHRIFRRRTIFKKIRVGATLNEEETIILKCRDGYYPWGANQSEITISCLSGKLSPEPKCLTDMCEVPSVSNGDLGRYEPHYVFKWKTKFKKIREGSTLNEEEAIILRCQYGYLPKGADQSEIAISCLSGKLSPDPVCVTDMCEVPTILNGDLGRYEPHYIFKWKTSFNKIRQGETVNEEESITLRCQDGYRPTGTNQSEIAISCLSGKLSPDPKCVSNMCDVPSVSNGDLGRYEPRRIFKWKTSFKEIREGATLKEEESLILRCHDGYVPRGAEQREMVISCLSTELSPEPKCVAEPCPDNPPVPENGRLKPTWGKSEHGAHVEYECLPNYDMTDEGSMVCSFGKWSGSVPSCEEKSTCSTASLYDLIPPNVVLHTNDDTESSVPIGLLMKLGCGQFGMVFKGNDSALCGVGGIWDVGPDILCSYML